MKKLFMILEKDYLKEGFTLHEWLTMGIIVPGLFILLLVAWSIIQTKVITGTI